MKLNLLFLFALVLLTFYNINLTEQNESILKINLNTGYFKAGVAKINGTLPLGTPLAGYNWGSRKVPKWPIPQFRNYTTWMMPSQGNMDPTWVKALIIDNGEKQICFVTLDGIGSDGTLSQMAYDIAVTRGFDLPIDSVIFSASHSHSGPGAVSPSMLWALAPATDLLVPELQRQLATSMADAMLDARSSMQSATVGFGVTQLLGVTENRRASISPNLNSDSIDPNLAILRVDDANGNVIATLWNFAIHGTCWGPSNMLFSGDIMGGACKLVEQQIGGVALFVNADAGDIDPTGEACSNKPDYEGAPTIANTITSFRKSIQTFNQGEIDTYSQIVDFGPTELNATLARFFNCTSGGPLDICSICEVIHCEFNPHLGSAWLEDKPRFTAFRLTINSKDAVFVTLPGEPLLELGWWVRNDTLDLGFDTTFLCGYANNHMGYFATPDEYDIGGYESELTFWGIDTADKVRQGCYLVAEQVVKN
eukprot:TRINITY_DN1936_c0_g2_i1.p1 TRINITY_DN1936_c0_g2~~TRINITY_DN1936_c0_g2_i1.p1  ORF type:complete len:480 (-),score=253.66 TRINITY_DN1936_c0_g2_i1:80-1519(-)